MSFGNSPIRKIFIWQHYRSANDKRQEIIWQPINLATRLFEKLAIRHSAQSYPENCQIRKADIRKSRDRKKSFRNFFLILYPTVLHSPGPHESIAPNSDSKFEREHAFRN